MAKNKKHSGAGPAPRSAKQERSWPWIALLGGLLLLVVVMVVLSLLHNSPGDTPTDQTTLPSIAPGVTAPPVDDSNTKTMRVVKAGTAYVEKKTTAGTVFSLRKGDRVEVVEMDHEWVTIAVEGRGYYLPRNMVRALDEHVIVIDAGHQLRADIGKEAVGPGSSDEVQKMDVGNVGAETAQQEYDVTMNVARVLKDELESRGYTVYLTRSNSAVNISNKERAEVANNLYADAYISLHTGFDQDPTVRGMGAVCQTAKNSYVSELYADNKALCASILDALVQTTENKKRDIQENDTLAGINWCQVPMALIELGCLSNKDEDRLLSGSPYHEKLAKGIANGLDAFFAEKEKK